MKTKVAIILVGVLFVICAICAVCGFINKDKNNNTSTNPTNNQTVYDNTGKYEENETVNSNVDDIESSSSYEDFEIVYNILDSNGKVYIENYNADEEYDDLETSYCDDDNLNKYTIKNDNKKATLQIVAYNSKTNESIVIDNDAKPTCDRCGEEVECFFEMNDNYIIYSKSQFLLQLADKKHIKVFTKNYQLITEDANAAEFARNNLVQVLKGNEISFYNKQQLVKKIDQYDVISISEGFSLINANGKYAILYDDYNTLITTDITCLSNFDRFYVDGEGFETLDIDTIDTSITESEFKKKCKTEDDNCYSTVEDLDEAKENDSFDGFGYKYTFDIKNKKVISKKYYIRYFN